MTNEPAKLSDNEAIQIAHIMENIKQKVEKPAFPLIVPPIASENAPVQSLTPTNEVSAVSVKRLTKEEYEALKNAPPVELTGELLEKVKAEVLKEASIERAQKEPVPNIIQHAFDGEDIEIEVFNIDKKEKEIVKIRRMRAIDISIFKLVKSPLYSIIMGDIDGKDVNKKLSFDEEAMYDLATQFILPPRDAYKLAKKGIDAFHDEAMELGIKYSVGDVTLIVDAVVQYIGLVNEAKTQFETPPATTSETVDEELKKN